MSTSLANQPDYSSHSGGGSVGPVIVVLVVITILGVIAGMIGRICTGRSIMGHGQFDAESWIERKCSSCINGQIDAPPPRANAGDGSSGGGSVPVAVVIENPSEAEKTERSNQKQPAAS